MRRFEFYKVRRNDNLASEEFWNPRLEDLDNRLALREDDARSLQAAADNLLIVGLGRINDTFQPLVEDARTRLQNLGASFSAESTTSAAVATGPLVLTLTPETAESYVYTDYVTARSSAAPTAVMLGQVVSFDRPSRQLTLNVVDAQGSGTHADWLIRVGTPPETGHATRTDNPHATTAAQVGAYTTAQTDTAIATAVGGISLSGLLVATANLDDLADKAEARDNLGLGAAATRNVGMAAGTVAAGNDSRIVGAVQKAGDSLTGGFTTASYDAGTRSSGTFTPDPANGNMQHAVNNGAHTLAPPTAICSMVVQYTNGAAAGALSWSGFTKVSGATYTTTNGHKFLLFITRSTSYSLLHVAALQ